MSPDEIFAAHMWSWPDPVLKRDPMGRILFINAAFLGLYGGRVEDWSGNTVGGWPAPQGGHVPSRFETRMPGHNGEQVFDWIEYTLSDNNALCIARNVTELMAPPAPPPAASAPIMTGMEANTMGHHAPMHETPPSVMDTLQIQTPQTQTPLSAPSTATMDASNHAAMEHNSAPSAQPAPMTETSMPAFEDAAPHMPQDVPMPPSTDITLPPVERDHERRALPIEDGDAVLGNNWRDAVIAKAVGASDAGEPVAMQDASAPSQDHAPHNAQLRILLAEDNAINALLTRTLLEAEGCSVDVVEDGALAVEAVRNAPYDMIFMDMRMPNMDGLEATRKIRALPTVAKDLPIVALTANAFDDDRNACFDSGMNDFMTKPVSAEELSQMVANWSRPTEQRAAS